jgi:CubicO group peptidase (beta-lactamase class C family)
MINMTKPAIKASVNKLSRIKRMLRSGPSRIPFVGWRESLLTATAVLALFGPVAVSPAAAQVAMSRGSASQIAPGRLAGLSDFVDGVVAEQIVKREVAGAVITVVHGRKVLFTHGYGYADIDKKRFVDPQRTLFRPGSVSKLFTWTALMQQVEAGKVNLDAPVEQYLDFKLPPSRFKPMRVRDLMTHTAGFGDQSAIFVKSQAELIGFRNWMKANRAMLVREPGAEISYSNYGAALAGYIVEQVSGQSFNDYVEDHIFRPLGMQNTTFQEPLPPRLASDVATGYKVDHGRFLAKGFEFVGNIGPAGSSSATGPDMARFILAMLNNGASGANRILKPTSVHLLESDAFKNAPNLPGFAHGFMVFREHGPRIVEHGGNLVDQHSYLLLAPEADFGLFVSFTGGAKSSDARTELVDAIIGRLFPQAPAARWQGATTTAPMGSYRSNRRDYSKPADPKHDVVVSAAGPHGLTVGRSGEETFWEQIGPKLFEQQTGAREGGPYDELEFYGPAGDPRMSFGTEPHELYRLVGK